MFSAIISFLMKRFGVWLYVAGGLVVGIGAALTWHYIDRAVAVRNAQQALADEVTIASQAAQLEALDAKLQAEEEARVALRVEVAIAEAEANLSKQELEQYVSENDVNADCVVDGAVIKRLRNR